MNLKTKSTPIIYVCEQILRTYYKGERNLILEDCINSRTTGNINFLFARFSGEFRWTFQGIVEERARIQYFNDFPHRKPQIGRYYYSYKSRILRQLR